jgi:hypothetical protein
MLALVQPIIRYRGKNITEQEISFIRSLIAANPKATRRRLSLALCEAWSWRQPNGQLCDAICRGLLLVLHRRGDIQLPAAREHGSIHTVHRSRPAPVLVDQSPLIAALKDLLPLTITQVRRTSLEPLYDGLIEQFHYLHYCHPVGEHLKYVVFAGSRPIACFAFSSSPRHLGCRDRFIGWTAEQRKGHIRLIAYNTRFLVLPWVQVRFLASHLLSRIARVVKQDWQQVYHHPLYFLETFVDTARFVGTSYRAANWTYLGQTTGRGKDAPTHKATRSIKAVWGYALDRRFRQHLCGDGE